MPAAVRNVSTALGSPVLSVPPGTTQRDLLVAFLASEAELQSSPVTITGGWTPLATRSTRVGTVNTPSGIIGVQAWWKTASASESSYTISDVTEWTVAAAVAITDADTPTASSSVANSTNGTRTGTSPAAPTPATTSLALRWIAGDNYSEDANRTWTNITTELADLEVDYLAAQLVARTTGHDATLTHTVSANLYAWAAITVAIPDAPVFAPSQPLAPSGAAMRASIW
ncbi:hypothetical protein AB0K18_42740 [Nonomuraea sp. NPDC049421]|uniref:hypothetical protein n=1 Tax=Nonomuraea sp. NPDC049421 TaxID=3155275 RepID=UPI00341354DC